MGVTDSVDGEGVAFAAALTFASFPFGTFLGGDFTGVSFCPESASGVDCCFFLAFLSGAGVSASDPPLALEPLGAWSLLLWLLCDVLYHLKSCGLGPSPQESKQTSVHACRAATSSSSTCICRTLGKFTN